MERKVFWSGIEYVYQKGSKGYENLKGGFVFVFTKAFDVREALAKIIEEFNEKKLDIIEIEFIKPYEIELGWETPEQTIHYLGLYNESNDTNETIFDAFYAYENE